METETVESQRELGTVHVAEKLGENQIKQAVLWCALAFYRSAFTSILACIFLNSIEMSNSIPILFLGHGQSEVMVAFVGGIWLFLAFVSSFTVVSS